MGVRVAVLVVFTVALGGALFVGSRSAPDQGGVPQAVAPAVVVPGEGRVAASAKPEPACRAGDLVAMRGTDRAHAARARRDLAAFEAPGGSVLGRFGRINVNGVPTVFGVLTARLDASCAPAWYKVQLPMRPNGRTGWVRAADVRVTPVDTHIVVDLSDRRVTLYKAGAEVLQVTATIGKPETPTPTGSYYVNQRLRASDTSGPFGPGGIGISAFSPTLEHWPQGGPIAIHGTAVPHLLGDAVSFGCVRVRNDHVVRMFELVPEGTPVVIRG
jgi:hypothetical protein